MVPGDAGTLGRMELAERLLQGDPRALARAISMVERRDPELPELLAAVRGRAGAAHVVGITGPPGGGKSTLADGLIERWRAQGRSIGVLACDPSSPFSGGAILGDRVRMQRHTLDRGVYIRSMASRGHLGGLASATREAIRLIDASGRAQCLLETVGVGQSELEVMHAADTVVLVITPLTGDGVQLIKAGIMEIPDVIVLNKADLPGADRALKELRALVHETAHSGVPRRGWHRGDIAGSIDPARWEPPVLRTVSTTGEGLDELVAAIDDHRRHLDGSGELQRRRADRFRAEVEAIVAERAVQRVRESLPRGTIDVPGNGDLSRLDPYAAAAAILDRTTRG